MNSHIENETTDLSETLCDTPREGHLRKLPTKNLFVVKKDLCGTKYGVPLVPELKSETEQFGCTMQICPYKMVNKKRWDTYTHEKQIEVLNRGLASVQRKNPSINITAIYFEKTPGLPTIHTHFIATVPKDSGFEHHMYSSLSRFTNPEKGQWRGVVIKEVFNLSGWMDYIRKSQH